MKIRLPVYSCTVILPFLLLVTGILKWQYSQFTNNIITKDNTDAGLYKSVIPSLEEYKKMTVHVQNRITELQNPYDCKSAKKIVCDLPNTQHGFGSQIHFYTVCFTVGFLTGRTVVIKKDESQYRPGLEELLLPFSSNCTTSMNQRGLHVRSLFQTEDIPVIHLTYYAFYLHIRRALPQYITNVIKHFHSNPSLWFTGQIASYILRPNKRLKYLISKQKRELGFQNLIVGLHVRRTDKVTEGLLWYNLTQYMKFAEKFYISYGKRARKTGLQRTIYLATDDPSVVIEAKRDFPDYTFINDINITVASNILENRHMYSSLIGLLLDIFLLAECDYLVCTMSSNICRLAFELMQPRFTDGSKYVHSLDWEYFVDKLE